MSEKIIFSISLVKILLLQCDFNKFEFSLFYAWLNIFMHLESKSIITVEKAGVCRIKMKQGNKHMCYIDLLFTHVHIKGCNSASAT